MNKKLITLILAAGCVAGAIAAVPGPAGNFNTSPVWPRSDIDGIGAAGLTTRGYAMFDSQNDLGAVDRLTEALRTSAVTNGLSLAEKNDVEQVLAIAEVLSGSVTPVEDVRQWIDTHHASPHRADMQLLLADLLLEKGNYGEARNIYESLNADELTPALREDFLYHRAYSELIVGEYNKAHDEFMDSELTASRKYGNAVRFYLGYIDYVDKKYKDAEEWWSKIDTSTRPGSMAAYYRAQIAFSQGRYDDAMRLARPLLTNTDVSPIFTAEANRIVGESLYQKGSFADAIPYLKKYVAVAEMPERSTRYILGLAQYEEGDYRAAVESLTPVCADKSAMGQSAYLYIGQALLKLGDDNGAIMAFNRAIEMDFDRAVTEVAYYNYAVAKSRGANVPFASSVETFEEFLSRFPDSRFADDVAQYIVTGYLSGDNYEAALNSINSVHNPSNALLGVKQKVLYNLGARRLAADRTDEAISLLRRASELDKYDAEIARETKLILGEALYRKGDYQGAVAELLEYVASAPSANPNRAIALYDLGYARMGQKEWGNAATDFERVVANPGDMSPAAIADAQARLGDARYYQRNWGGAAEAYDAAYKTDPASGDYPLFQKAVMQGYNRDYNGKLATLNNLEKKFPTSAVIPDALLEKAEAYVQLGKIADADNVYRRLITDYPSTSQGRSAYLNLASDLVSAGKTDDAIRTYQDLVSSAPTSEEARVANEAVKRLHAERGTLDDYNEFLAQVGGTPTMDTAETETLTWNAAEHAYLAGKGVSLMQKYLNDYPKGRYEARALACMLDYADEQENEDDAYRWATLILENYPDDYAVEDALLVKAEIEYRRGRGMDALAAWEELDEKASDVETKNIARLGIMRVARDMGDSTRLRATSDALINSSTLGAEEKTEAAFSKALAMSLDGETDDAIAAWQKLAENADDLYGAKSAVYAAEALIAAGRYDEAAKISETFVNSGTPHTYWLGRGFITLSDAYAGQGRDFEATEYLKALKENYPGEETDIFDMIDERLNK